MLPRSADIASIDGLDGVSIGRLAADLSVSKAGVFAHFGSKEDLQLATVQAAAERFVAEVGAGPHRSRGVDRLVALYDCWLDYCRRRVFPGGCFFSCTFGRVPRPAWARARTRSPRSAVAGCEAGAGLVAAAQ